MKTYEIAVIPGDGIGTEVMPQALNVLKRVAEVCDFGIKFRNYDWNCETWLRTGQMMPKDGIDQLSQSDSILLGAVGFPSVPDHISLWGLLIPIRREFHQYVNLRPVRLLPGIPCPLANKKPGDIDFWIVRENCEGEYSQIGGVFGEGTPSEGAMQTAVFTRYGTDRILRYAFEYARKLGRLHVTSATKSNGLFHSMPYWDSRFEAIGKEYPDVRMDQYHIDILAARFVMSPERFDVVVGSNLFGDILSDLGPGITGTIAVAPSANINPERAYPSMFEPVHGSAPDIAGRFIANPVGQIWAAAMMLEHLGEPEAAGLVMQAIEKTLENPATPRTPDMGGTAGTRELGAAIVQNIPA
ncbi:tartrate dehydrogenase [Acetobacter fabarum]|uniref:tartrate dehydrogenase n=1 Tax=Acetobacter fabarum TaxID=483199 RepID=UPI0039ECDB35